MSAECLLIHRLSKNFGGLRAVSNLTLRVEAGERHAVIGANGAGKTTLFNLISGTICPSSGTVHLFGRDVTYLSPPVRAALGLARTFQTTSLFPNLTLFENVLLSVQSVEDVKSSVLPRGSTRQRLKKRTYELLEEWGMQQRAGELVRHLSYGDQRQVDLILALVSKPKLLLLDEPTAGLSPAETAFVAEAIRRLDGNMTIVLIEHDMDVVFSLADRVSVLHLGSLHAEGSVSEIKNDPRVREIYLGNE